jgi:acyl dehydratase
VDPHLAPADLAVPRQDRRLEDYEPGAVCVYGPVRVTEAEIVDFARVHDPQPFHTDPVAAAAGPFGGLVASGMHSLAIAGRLFVGAFLPGTGSLGSPGFDEVRFLLPVRPGDELRLRVTVLESRRSRSKPDRGLVRTGWELLNQDGDIVLTLNGLNFISV